MKTLIIDGKNHSNFEALCKEFRETVFVDSYNQWNGNLDAFNDLLRDVDCTIIWKNFAQSKKKLSYSETVKILKERLEYCHPTNRPLVREDLQKAESAIGPTILDWVLEIIAEHDNVVLILE
jgi:RNAse (barnase) inhibitor barstar